MRIIFTLVFLSQSLLSIAQTYSVIHVIGKIYNSKTNQYLKAGIKLDENSKLKFETPDAKAAVLSSTKGRYIIQNASEESAQNNLFYALASVLSPARGKMSTRAGGINNQMDFNKKFGEGRTAWIGDVYKVSVSPIAYPIDENHFFYVSYEFNNETINKKITNRNDTLIFEKSDFYAVDEFPIDPRKTSNLVIYYYDVSKKVSSKITSIDFAIVGQDELIEIINSLDELNESEVIVALQEIVSSMYGKCTDAEIQDVIETINR